MKFLVIILLILIIGLVIRLVLYKRDLYELIKEIKYIDSIDFVNRKLSTRGYVEDVNKLREAINFSIEENLKIKNDYRKAESRNKEIIASISHDLRTPLTSIKGYTELLSTRVEDEKSKKYIEIIASRSESLSRLIDTFYDLSKLEVKAEDYNMEYVNLRQILEEVLASHYERFLNRGISPIVEIDSGDFDVLGDTRAIERVFGNLIDNGIKYSESYMKIVLKKENGKIVSSFINDNRDLDQDKIKQLFNKFFVVDTSRQSESTGLGLFITREIVESLGYSIGARLIDGFIEIDIDWTEESK